MKYTLAFRIWHWFNAFVVTGLVATVLLRETFLSWRTNAQIIIDKFATFNIEVTQEQAKIVAKAIRAGMWEWHIILGYALAFAILYRIVLFFVDTSVKQPWSALDRHKKIVKVSYAVLYGVLLFMSISGFVLYFHELLGITSEKAHEIKEVHEVLYNYIALFIPIHIVGVLLAENKDEPGLISSMIHGSK